MLQSGNHQTQHSTKRPAEESLKHSEPSGKKILAPGATQAAIARLAELRAQGTVTTANSTDPVAPTQKKLTFGSTTANVDAMNNITTPTNQSNIKIPAPGATQAALARLSSNPTAAKGSTAASALTPSINQSSIKIPAPGATQAALERLSSIKNMDGHLPLLPPPPRPLFNKGSQPSVGGGALVNSVANSLVPGSIVWAKLLSYPWWPAQIQVPSHEQNRLRHGPTDIFCVFYGTADYSWVPFSDVKPFKVDAPEYARFASSKNKGLQRAIDEAWRGLGQQRPDACGKLVLQPQ